MALVKTEITATDARSGQFFPPFKFDQKESTNTDPPRRYDRTRIASYRDDTVAH